MMGDEGGRPAASHDEPEPWREGFHRRVLDRLPTAVIVVNDAGDVKYGNEAAEKLSGWTRHHMLGANALELIHADDRHDLFEAFAQLALPVGPNDESRDRPWAPINFRFVRPDGQVTPVELTGNGSLHVPEIEGIIYEIRPAHERAVLQRALTSIASGAGLVEQFDLVLDVVSSGILDIDAAIVVRHGTGNVEVVRAGVSELYAVLDDSAHSDDLGSFDSSSSDPRFIDLTTLDGGLGAALVELGYCDAWTLEIADRIADVSYSLLGFAKIHQVPALGARERLASAADLASVVVMRSRTEWLLRRAAHHDPLTDLPNRLGLERAVEARRDEGAVMALLFLDLDDFKPVNDRWGHHVGDELLDAVGRRLLASTGSDDVVARIGGDEFAVVLVAPTGTNVDADQVARRLNAAIAQPMDLESGRHTISASIGVIDLAATTDLAVALEAADRAMYEAKRDGGDRSHRGHLGASDGR